MKRGKSEILGIQAPKSWMIKPRNFDIGFSFWQLFDELGSWFLQGAAVVGGGPYTPILNPLTGEITITSGGIKIYFPMWGTVIDISGGANINVPSGNQVIFVPDIKYPVINQTKSLRIAPPGSTVHNQGQFCFFLGGRRGNTVYLRPDSALSA